MALAEMVADRAGNTGIAGSIVGCLTASAGALTLNDMLAIGGFMVALVSVSFQIWATWYFKSRHLKIAEARLAAELADTGEDDG